MIDCKEACLREIVINTPESERIVNERIAIMSPSGEQIGVICYEQIILTKPYLGIRTRTVTNVDFKMFKFKNHSIYYDPEVQMYDLYFFRELIETSCCPFVEDDIAMCYPFNAFLKRINKISKQFRRIIKKTR